MDTTATVLQALTERLDALEAENRALRRRVETGAPSAGLPASPPIDVTAISRRRLVLGGGAAALGAVAAASAASPVAAAPAPEPLIKNDENTVDLTTSIRGDIDHGISTNVFASALAVANENATTGTGLYAGAKSIGVAALASANGGTGVFARSEAGGVAVHGYTYGDPGLSPVTPYTAGIWGQISTSYPTAPAFLADGGITLRSLLNPGGKPASDGAEGGDLSIRREADGTATWWVCMRAATDDADAEFVRLASPGSGGSFEPLPAPLRTYDSRPGMAPETGPKAPLAVGDDRTIDCTLNVGDAVPADARVLSINLTATQGTDGGYLAAHGADVAWSGASNLNYAAGQSVANAVTVRCDQGRIKVRAGGPSGTVHFIVDVVGFSR